MATQKVLAQPQLSYPTEWSDSYTDGNKLAVHTIIDWINQHSQQQTTLAKAAQVSSATINSILRGRYPSPPGKQLKTINDAINMWITRKEGGIHQCPFVETSVFLTIVAACKRAHLYRNFSVVSAFVGTGKTRSLEYYNDHNSGVFLLHGTTGMTPSVMITELVELTGAIVHKSHSYAAGTLSEKMAAVIRILRNSDSLIILDEAETVSNTALEYLRRISDKAGIGVMLAGTEKLRPLIRDPRGRFGQISSRVGFWPPAIQGITKDDAISLSMSSFGEKQVLTDEVLDALWQMCDGSARVLLALIPGIKDYGLKKNFPLTAELVFKVGSDVLGFTRNSTRRVH